MGDGDEKKDSGLFKSYPKEKPEKEGWQFKAEGERKDKSEPATEKKWGSLKDPKGKKKDSGPETTVGFGPLYQGPKDSGAIFTTRERAEDKSFASVGHYEYNVQALSAAYDIDKKKAELEVVKAEGKASAVHATVDFIDAIKKLFGLGQPEPVVSTPEAGGGPMAARVFDTTAHGAPLAPGTGSPNVLIGGRPAWRATVDFMACPVVKGLVPDVGGMVLVGAPTVLINGLPATRVGDMVVESPGGPNPIVTGCPTVMIGTSGAPSAPKKLPPVDGDLKATGDLLVAEAAGRVGGSFDIKKKEAEVGAKVEAMAAVAKGDVAGALKLRIPFTKYYFGLGATAEGSVLSAGVKAEASAAFNKQDPKTGRRKLFQGEAGAGAALGLGGSVKFSLSIEAGD